MKIRCLTLLGCLFITAHLSAQQFFYGADLSYVNEMEDCGVQYRENGSDKDVYDIFADHHFNLVRLRLWHTPAWYDTLNAGKRYSDLADVRKAILRAKTANMQVLLDFHLSDTWADPQKQVAPAAWNGVLGNLPALQDSLRNYISATLLNLHQDNLLPDMVQIGNETNRGILLSEAQNNAGWQLDWPRNSALFKTAIEAVRAVSAQSGKQIKIALHLAGPADTEWLVEGFWSHGVQDFDIIGMSYYWAWHQPTTIAQCGNVIQALKSKYPGKAIMVFETGYIWTTQSNDAANNIINSTHPDYAPASPQNQRQWLIDLSEMVQNRGGNGVIYWEPAWQSSACFTPWGQGSHQEHATFFDFSNNVLPDGGMFWPVPQSTAVPEAGLKMHVELLGARAGARQVVLRFSDTPMQQAPVELRLFDLNGRQLAGERMPYQERLPWILPDVPAGAYYLQIKIGQWTSYKSLHL